MHLLNKEAPAVERLPGPETDYVETQDNCTTKNSFVSSWTGDAQDLACKVLSAALQQWEQPNTLALLESVPDFAWKCSWPIYDSAQALINSLRIGDGKNAFALLKDDFAQCGEPWMLAEYCQQLTSMSRAYVEATRTLPRLPVEVEVDTEPVIYKTLMDEWESLASEVIPHVFEEGLTLKTFGVLVAPGGIGKSFLALQAGLSVVLGRALVDGFTPTEQGRVLLLFGEDDKHIVSQRMMAICDALDVKPAEISAAINGGRLQFVCGQSASLLDFTIGGSAVRSQGFRDIEGWCKDKRYRLVVVDPFIKWAGVPNENDNAVVEQAAQACADLAKASGGAVLVIHHANKAGATSGDVGQTLSRGGSSLTDAARWVATLRLFNSKDCDRYGMAHDQSPQYLELAVAKNTNRPTVGHRVTLTRGPGGVLKSIDMRTVQSAGLLAAIVSELSENPVNLTSREMSRGVGSVAKLFKEGIESRTGAEVSQREIETAIHVGIQREILYQRPINDGKPGRKRFSVEIAREIAQDACAI